MNDYLLLGFGVTMVFLMFKYFTRSTNTELRKIGKDIHKGVGKIDILTDEIKRYHNINKNFNLNRGKHEP